MHMRDFIFCIFKESRFSLKWNLKLKGKPEVLPNLGSVAGGSQVKKLEVHARLFKISSKRLASFISLSYHFDNLMGNKLQY